VPLDERDFYRWQLFSHACIYAGKPRGGQWSLQVGGRCPLTKKEVNLFLRADTLLELRDALLSHPTIVAVLTDPLVRKAIGK